MAASARIGLGRSYSMAGTLASSTSAAQPYRRIKARAYRQSVIAASSSFRHSPSSCSAACSFCMSSDRRPPCATAGATARLGDARARYAPACHHHPHPKTAASGRTTGVRAPGSRGPRGGATGAPPGRPWVGRGGAGRKTSHAALLAQDALDAADGIALAVEEMADAAQEADVVGTIVAPSAAALERLDLAEAALPEAQHMLRNVELVRHFADGTECVRRLVHRRLSAPFAICRSRVTSAPPAPATGRRAGIDALLEDGGRLEHHHPARGDRPSFPSLEWGRTPGPSCAPNEAREEEGYPLPPPPGETDLP